MAAKGPDATVTDADVLAAGRPSEGLPLREHELLAAASPRQRAQLRENLAQDLIVQKPRLMAWRENLG